MCGLSACLAFELTPGSWTIHERGMVASTLGYHSPAGITATGVPLQRVGLVGRTTWLRVLDVTRSIANEAIFEGS